MKPLHISLNTTHSDCKPCAIISFFTHSQQVFLSLLAIIIIIFIIIILLSHPCHHHISTGRHPIISTLTFHISKPPQSTMPHHLSHALNPKKLYKSTLHFLSFSDTPHIHLTIIRSVLSRLQICFLHRPGFSPICQYTLDTSLVYLSLYAVWCTPSCQDRR